MKKAQSILFVLFLSHFAFGYFEPKKNENEIREMNGISFDQYKDFPEEWTLVTVRFREDSKELRFTYANDIALKAMKELKPNYPEGAIFGKVSFLTEDDPAFPSSKVPATTKRFQLMVKNKSKYDKSDGWGYALFDNSGNIYNEDIKKKTDSCVACHRIVPERDFVFSRKIGLSSKSLAAVVPENSQLNEIIKFETVKTKDTPAKLKALVKRFDYVNSLTGPLSKFGFSGTLDEIMPFLISKSKMSSAPTALILNEGNFSIAVPTGKKCTQTLNGEMMQLTIYFNSQLVRDAKICN